MAARRTVRHGSEAFTFERDEEGGWAWSDAGWTAKVYKNWGGAWCFYVRYCHKDMADGYSLTFRTTLSRAAEAIVEQRRC